MAARIELVAIGNRVCRRDNLRPVATIYPEPISVEQFAGESWDQTRARLEPAVRASEQMAIDLAREASATRDLIDAAEEILNTEWLGGKGGLHRLRAAVAKARGA